MNGIINNFLPGSGFSLGRLILDAGIFPTDRVSLFIRRNILQDRFQVSFPRFPFHHSFQSID